MFPCGRGEPKEKRRAWGQQEETTGLGWWLAGLKLQILSPLGSKPLSSVVLPSLCLLF